MDYGTIKIIWAEITSGIVFKENLQKYKRAVDYCKTEQ